MQMLIALLASTMLSGPAPSAAMPSEVTAAARAAAWHDDVPPPAWLQSDPADSLYRAAREALNRGDYRRAAELFGRLQERFPDSGYAGDALYWRAFALYKANGTDELRAAMLALQTRSTRYARAQTHDDAQVLATRICGELARRGDADCAAKVRVEADRPCSEESKDMKLAALNAVQNMDPEQALPLLRGVLSRRDNCSADLRRKAVFLIADQNTPKAADILIDVVHNDPDEDVRREAVWWLSEVHGDRAFALLDSIARSSRDEELRSKAIDALAEQGDARSRRALRQLIEQPGVSDDAKARAILAIGQFGRPSPDDGAYLRQQYASLRSDRLKEKVIESLGNSDDAESRRWLLALAQNPNEDIDLRKQALFWAAQSKRASGELIPLYDKLREPEMKEQMIFVYSNLDDKASTDKLIEIARKEPNRELRKKAIFWLGQKDDPRVRQILMEIINQ